MNFLQLIQTRRSIRRYRDRPVQTGLIDQLLDAARRATWSHRRQLRRFTTVVSR